MDRYQRVEKPRPETAINENEIRITAQGLIRNYISYATSLLQVRFQFSLFLFFGLLVLRLDAFLEHILISYVGGCVKFVARWAVYWLDIAFHELEL